MIWWNFIHISECLSLTSIAISVAAAVGTLAAVFGRIPYLELATHFRFQYAVVSSACVILLIGCHSWAYLPLALCCAILNWAYILPYYFEHPRAVLSPSAIHVRLMLANVLKTNKDYAALASVIHGEGPDIVVLQEFTEKWQKHSQPLRTRFSHFREIPRSGGTGMALFSMYPLEEVEVLSFGDSPHLALFARVNIDGARVSILALHPPTPVRPQRFPIRNEQFARAASILKATLGPKLLIGDLNTSMWSPYFRDLVKDSGLWDARLGFGLLPSWPVSLPAILQIPIDHCLVGEGITVEDIRTDGRSGSDHLPLIVDVSFERSARK